MKKRIARILILMMMTPWGHRASCETTTAPMLPTGLSQLIQEAFEVRREAIRFKEMRYHDMEIEEEKRSGALGKKFRSIMDRIAEFPMDVRFIAKANELQDTDIQYKMVVWALDRKRRPGEYARFSKWYLNDPLFSEDRIEHYLRGNPDANSSKKSREEIMEIRVIHPNPVSPQDKIEENRPIFEFSCYAPPDGQQFEDISARSILMQALSSMGKHEKSFVVWKSDLDMVLEIPIEEGEDAAGVNANTRHAISAIMHIETKEAFSVLGAKWPQDRARQAMELLFKNSWLPLHSNFDEVTYAKAKKHYDAWMALASAEWKTPGEKGFAEWLKQQAPPKAPPPQQYTDDPNDPFLPLRPSSKSE